MKLSFVIPAYNEELYIGKCIEAILRETKGRTDVEIIVVDNNSTDHTSEAVAKYPEAKLIHETRRGANRTRQTGFEASTGELVAFLDADTVLPHGWTLTAERAFAKDEKLVCLTGPFIYYDLPPFIQLLVKLFYGIGWLVYIFNNFILKKTSMIQGGNYILRRTALEAVGGHNVNLTFYGDDADLAWRLSKVGEVRFSYRFTIPSSGRRLAKEGAFTMGLRYGINYFWVALFKRPFTTVSTEVRIAQGGGKFYAPQNKIKEATIVVLTIALLAAILGAVAYLIYWLFTL